jgi:hypothetical protein
MATTQLLAIAVGAANSTDIVVTDTPMLVGLKASADPAPNHCQIEIQIKDDEGNYATIGELRFNHLKRAITITGPGTYRLSRTPDSAACGAFIVA